MRISDAPLSRIVMWRFIEAVLDALCLAGLGMWAVMDHSWTATPVSRVIVVTALVYLAWSLGSLLVWAYRVALSVQGLDDVFGSDTPLPTDSWRTR